MDDPALDDLAEARAKLDAARQAIRSTPELAGMAGPLERMAAKLNRIELAMA